MKLEFFANQIEIGDDDTEEVYRVQFTEADPTGGAPKNYLLFQRSVVGLNDADFLEPYIEVNDPVNGKFAKVVRSGELLPTFIHLILTGDSNIAPDMSRPNIFASEIIVRFDADGPLLRKLKYAMELVVSDAFQWRSLA